MIKDMPRLCASLTKNEGLAEVNLSFGKDQGVVFLEGQLAAQLELQCQRCMEPYLYEIMSDFRFGVISSEKEAEKLSKRYDPIVVTDDKLFLRELIEDELIVNLPVVPMHDVNQCKITLPLKVGDIDNKSEEDNNPFKVIELLKFKREK